MEQTLKTYQQSLRNNFSFQKNTNQFDELMVKAIPLNNGAGYLAAVSNLHLSDQRLADLMSVWHAKNNPEEMTSWISDEILAAEDSILFLVLDKFGHAFGHLGLRNGLNQSMSIEIDYIAADKQAEADMMSAAIMTLIDWVDEFVHPQVIFLNTASADADALKFYRSLGFVDDKSSGQSKRMQYQPERKIKDGELILTAGPSISAREVTYVMDAAKHGWNHQWNKYIKRFEQEFSDYVGMKYVMSTSSCTGALHIALQALGIGPGDEVIVPDITWVATANAVVYVGATPVFADVDPVSWCLDPASFESLITDKTKAVIPVHLYGHPAPMDEIAAIARKHHLYIIEDAAPAIGAECNGRKVGTYGDFVAFSLQGAKLVVSGEGGILLTNNEELFKKAYAIWDQGRVPGTFWINQNGLKYKMSNVQAALGLGQLERVDELIESKRRIFSWYEQGLAGCKKVQLNKELPWARSIYWMTSILVDKNAGISRDELREKLKQQHIDTRSVFPAISQYPHWPRKQAAQPTAFMVGEQAINLPSGVCLKKEQVDYVCKTIRTILGE